MGHKIITKNNTAIGIRYVHKKQKDADEKQAFGKVILANAAIPNVVNTMLGDTLQNTEYQQSVNSLEIACSLLTVYLAFNRPPSDIGNKHYSTFIYDKDISLKDMYSLERSNDYAKKGFTFVDYSIIDSELTKEGYSWAICVIDYLDHWDQLCEDEYKSKKHAVEEILIERLDKAIPGIKDIIVFSEVATPMTIVRYTQNPGSVYGFSQTVEQAGPKIASVRKPPIENLFFASVWASSGGFSGAIHSGYACALKILKDY